ncbi:MAG: DUF3343 domain-containing protein [Clostridia bacterium]|nr:DUF3343 domain-containing protein [Clostridia bacterium]
MNYCTAAIGSLTATMKAHSALSTSGIGTKIVKLDPSMTKRGCAYGIEYSCSDHKAVRSALNEAKISVTSYIKGGGGEIV